MTEPRRRFRLPIWKRFRHAVFSAVLVILCAIWCHDSLITASGSSFVALRDIKELFFLRPDYARCLGAFSLQCIDTNAVVATALLAVLLIMGIDATQYFVLTLAALLFAWAGRILLLDSASVFDSFFVQADIWSAMITYLLIALSAANATHLFSRVNFTHRYGPWAAVLGASEGLGAAFAVDAARRGLNVVLVARREKELQDVARQIEREFNVQTRVVVADLSDVTFAAQLAAVADREGLDIGLVVYNAALVNGGEYLLRSLDDIMRSIDVNARAPAALAHVFGSRFKSRRPGRGGVVLLSSMGAYGGLARIATYAATKAFSLILTEGLWTEFSWHGLDALVVLPGATASPNWLETRPTNSAFLPIDLPADVARQGLDALGNGPSVVTGRANKAVALLNRFLPRRVILTMMERSTRGGAYDSTGQTNKPKQKAA